MLYADTTDKIIKAFYKVNNALGFGFLEKVYENALAIELQKMGSMFGSRKILRFIMKVKRSAIIMRIW